jgi:diguanylate cyclase (GGDEF)-like protein
VRVSQSLLALVVYLVFAALQHGEVVLGLVDLRQSNLLTLFNLAGALGFYALVRSGFSERRSDPALTLPQMVWGLLSTAGSYAITGPARGAVMTLMVVILVFGMFALAPRQARGLALFTLGLLSAVMLWKSRVEPERYPPVIEAVHFLFSVIVLSGVSALAVRMGSMRARLKAQKADLEHALEQIRLLAIQDELTGMYNRRHMTTLLQQEQARQQRDDTTMCLVLADIDLFKRVNDTHGHHAGDVVLQRFAQVSRGALRNTDVMARWGGEEFLMMLRNTTPEQATIFVERLRAQLARTSFDDVAPSLRVTFSAGVSVCSRDDALEAAIERADHAMYRAKTQGRNCTALA